MYKLAVFGCKSTTIFLLDWLKKTLELACVVTISPQIGDKNQVADYVDVAQYCKKHSIYCYTAQRYDLKSDTDRDTFRSLQLDIGFVIGWQRLIPPEVLETFSVGVFGMHGSTDDLPLGRGRSPMNWALIEQRKHFFTNMFRYDPGIDSGEILDTFIFSIQPGDTGETMHYKNVLAMKRLIFKNLDSLLSGKPDLKRQREVLPTYYPKRSPEDSLIDWRQDVFQLDAFIRAVTRPFNGAFSFVDHEKVILWRASIFETDLVDYGYRDTGWGTVVEVFPTGKVVVKCRGGLLIVHEYEAKIKIEGGMLLESPVQEIRCFERNASGYHDLMV